jgi:hypothetical protein
MLPYRVLNYKQLSFYHCLVFTLTRHHEVQETAAVFPNIVF